jgi:nucleoside-diphosphate-sugar epimerase
MTGGYGCIGSWITRLLMDRDQDVWIYDLRADTHRLDLLLDADERRRVHFEPGDVADPASVRTAIERSGATHVIHLAGLQVPACRDDPLLGARVNVMGTLAVFEAARALSGQVERVVYASSAAVHGPIEPSATTPVPDHVRLSPVTHYGAFKVANELAARVYWLDHGLSSVGLRPWTVYGVGRDFGVTSEPTRAIKSIAVDRPFKISYGGLQDFQYAPDVAGTFLAALERPFQGADAFNLRGQVVPMETFVETLARVVLASAGRVTFGDRVLPIAPDLDASRLNAALGPLPETTLAQGIRETYERFATLRAEHRLDLADLS